jgi:hypothetical protein
MTAIPLKQWCAEEAERCDVTPSAIYLRLMRGKYPNVQLIRRNQRVVFVEKDKEFDWLGLGAFTEGTQ